MSKRDRGLEIMFYQVAPEELNSNKGIFIDKKFKFWSKVLNFKFHLFIS